MEYRFLTCMRDGRQGWRRTTGCAPLDDASKLLSMSHSMISGSISGYVSVNSHVCYY
jgi:hypothetical protein